MSLRDLFPDWYEDVKEIDVLSDAEDIVFDVVKLQLDQVRANQWVQTASENVLSMYEKMLDILANPSEESIEFRRQRVLNRLQSTPPFTMEYLKNQLNSIFGKGNYVLTVDHLNYTLFVEGAAADAEWFQEAEKIIRRVKPANMIFIQIPVSIDAIGIKETATAADVRFFKVGLSRIGRDPLRVMSAEKEVVLH